MRKMSLSVKLILGGIAAVLIPVMIVGIFAVVKSSDALKDLSLHQSKEIAKSLANMTDLAVQEELKIVLQLSQANAVINAAVIHTKGGEDDVDIKKVTTFLTNLVKSSGDIYEVIFVAGLDGKVFADGVDGKYKGVDLSDRDYIKTALSGKANIGPVVKARKGGLPCLTFAAPIYSKSNRLVGVVAAAPKLTFLTDKIDEVKLGKTGFAFAINKEGIVISHPQKELVLSINLHEQAGMNDLSDKMLSGKVGNELYINEGVKKVAGYAPAPMANLFIGVSQNYDELTEPARSIRNFIMITSIVFLILTVSSIVYFARSITLPIKNAVDEMSEAANQVAAASNQVAAASHSLASGASEQAAAIEETSSSLEEMSSMTKQNAGNASHADSLMKEAHQIVQKANNSIGNLTRSMAEISTASEETSKIVKTIDEIAFQTNLLALNAAVEAARAGEAGVGFAVVAEEVRNLAMRAADAAKNTSELIEGTVKKIKVGSDLVIETNDAFAEIAVSASKVGELVGEIAAASNEQSQGIDQINKAVEEMDKVTQQTAANAEENASASEEMNVQVEQMKHVSTKLVNIIGGKSNNFGMFIKKGQQVKKVLGNLSSVINNKGTGKESVSYKKSSAHHSHRLISMDDDQFKDF